jgi:hypothetical protein
MQHSAKTVASCKAIDFLPALRGLATYNRGVCEAAGLYISLNQCSLSQGLEHGPASVIISRQMNPMLVLTSPT